MIRSLSIAMVVVGLLAAGAVGAASVVDSAHNLSARGPGTVRAAQEARVCAFCHTTHQASPIVA